MVTIAQAKKLRYGQTLYHKKNRNSDGSAQRWRVSGKPKTWKKNKNRVQVPIKHGLYTNSYLYEHNRHLLQLKEPKRRSRKTRSKRYRRRRKR